ncbi:MAG: hypothetical protein JNM66_12745 [Bryobacterales bacterium]|nr:hypothetical protein [Bryobacterales bacterium]
MRLLDAMRVVLDDVQPDEGLRVAIHALIARQQLEADIQKVSELSRDLRGNVYSRVPTQGSSC